MSDLKDAGQEGSGEQVKRYVLVHGADEYWFCAELPRPVRRGTEHAVVLAPDYDRLSAENATLREQRDAMANAAPMLAEAVTERIFAIGREFKIDPHRIEYKIMYEGREFPAGGLARAPFETYTREALEVALSLYRKGP